ncbi:MAG: sortase-associated OmpA-like protein PdsO [Aestuariibacter sp.]
MKKLKLKKLSLVMACSLSAVLFANPAFAKAEDSNEDRNLMIGMGSGAAIGAAVAGPVGVVVGGVLGIFIGNEANHENEKEYMTLTLSDYEKRLQQAQQLAEQHQHHYQNAVAQLREIERQKSLVSMQVPTGTKVAPIEVNLQFATASHEIPTHYYASLDELASQLKQNADLRAQLFGYADRRGDEKYNLALSEQRALSVKEYLVQQGVSASKIDTDGYGEAQPVTQQQNWQNDFYDRRVVVRLTEMERLHTAAN